MTEPRLVAVTPSNVTYADSYLHWNTDRSLNVLTGNFRQTSTIVKRKFPTFRIIGSSVYGESVGAVFCDTYYRCSVLWQPYCSCVGSVTSSLDQTAIVVTVTVVTESWHWCLVTVTLVLVTVTLVLVTIDSCHIGTLSLSIHLILAYI